MATVINTHALMAQKLRSDEIGPLAMVAHPIMAAGQYFGQVWQGKAAVAQFQLTVEEASTPGQADIDLAALMARPGVGKSRLMRFKMPAGGYAAFFASKGAGGYAVTLDQVIEGKEPRSVFDSRKLTEGDVYAVTLLRPGLWIAQDAASGARAQVTVAYPVIGDTPFRPAERGHAISVSGEGMDRDTVKMNPGEGLVFQVGGKGTVLSLALEQPDDGPQKDGDRRNGLVAQTAVKSTKSTGRRLRWTNPRRT